MIPAIILAAGSGRRMGGPKALLRLDGETLLQRAVRIATTAGCAPVMAVVGDWDPGQSEAHLIHNDQAAEGMASSIRVGIAALPVGADRALLLTVDQIAVDANLLRRLMAQSTADPARPVACAYADTLGIPAILPRRLFMALQALRGDRGAKGILQAEQALAIPFPGGSTDLDTPQDLASLKR